VNVKVRENGRIVSPDLSSKREVIDVVRAPRGASRIEALASGKVQSGRREALGWKHLRSGTTAEIIRRPDKPAPAVAGSPQRGDAMGFGNSIASSGERREPARR
jgi:hypothetical protein